MAARAASDNRERCGGLAPELLTDRLEICCPELVAHGLLALVLDRALVVDQPLLGLTHELLQHLLEFWIGPAPCPRGRRVLECLDREIDLAVLLDGDDLRLHDVSFAEMIVNILDVVAVDLRDVDEPQASVFELEERPVRGDAGNGAVDHRADFDLCDESYPFIQARPTRATGASVREAVRAVNGPGERTRRSPAVTPARGSLRYRRRMLVRRFDDPVAFQQAATTYLVRDEARHNLLLGISTTLIQRPDLYEAFDLWVVSEGNDVAGVALRTHPFNLVLAQPSDDAALDALVDRLLQERQALPGVIAAIPELEAFVGAWTSENDLVATRVLRHGVYELRDILPLPAAPGNARPVTPGDRDQVIRWIVAFAEEALPEDNEAERQIRFVESRLAATEDAGLWFWEDGGQPVSISGYGGATPNGMRIGPVYTPPELRGRGYATTLVAEQSRWLLGTGRSLCFLYADLDNPTSNAVYRRIGYRMIAEAGEVRFDPRDAA